MPEDKLFLTYNQQMRKLRNNKQILCNGSSHKKILVRAGYFNIVNGYKNPFISGVMKTETIHISREHPSISSRQSKNLMTSYVPSF